MTAVRVLLVAVGLAVGAYGAVLLWDNPPVVLVRIVVWAAVGCGGARLRVRAAVRRGGIGGSAAAPGAVAVAGRGGRAVHRRAGAARDSGVRQAGMRPDNPTVLDRDYPLGLWISLAVVWACVPLYYLVMRLLPVRQDQVVEREGADDVERQPPSV